MSIFDDAAQDAVAAVTNPRHLSKSNEHFTPLNVVEAARKTMGSIDLDPATTAEANERRVKAGRFFTKDDDGMSKVWSGNVFVNSPGGRAAGNKSSQKLWWQKLVGEWTIGRREQKEGRTDECVKQAIFVSFSIELFQTSQVDCVGNLPLEFPFCIPSRRLAYDKEVEAEDGEVTYKTGESPPHASAIIYLPDSVESVKRFVWEFASIGHVCVPRMWS